MNTLMNDFTVQFEKSKLEAKQMARQVGDVMVEGIYERAFMDHGQWFDTTNQQAQQQQEQEEQELLELQALPFIIETDGFTEVCAQIEATEAAQNSKQPPPPPVTCSLVPFTNNTNNIVRLHSTTLSGQQQQQQPTAATTSTTPTSSQLVKPMTRTDTRNNSDNIIISKMGYRRSNQIDNTNNFRINKNSNIIINNINITTNKVNNKQHKAGTTGGWKYQCKSAGCGKLFRTDFNLAKHERIHQGIKPYICTWPDCTFSSAERSSIVKHIRSVHFKLPKTVKKQNELNIEDDRDPNEFVRVDQQLISRRL